MVVAVLSFLAMAVMVPTKSGLHMAAAQEHACLQGAVLAICGRVRGARPASKAGKLRHYWDSGV